MHAIKNIETLIQEYKDADEINSYAMIVIRAFNDSHHVLKNSCNNFFSNFSYAF
jgi:hypothetical protein